MSLTSAKDVADEKGKEKGEEKKELPKKKSPGGQEGHKGHGRKLPKNLPIVDRHVYLPPSNQKST